MAKKQFSRRDFIETGTAASIGVGVGIAAFKVLDSPNQQTIRLLTADGKLVEVERRHLPKQGDKASNTAILSWMKDNKAG